jgi:hypothetical protein
MRSPNPRPQRATAASPPSPLSRKLLGRLMVFSVLVALVFLGIQRCATSETPGITVQELINRNTQARGGKAAIEAVRNLEARVRIVEPAYTADGVWRVDRRGRMRVDVFVDDKRVFTEAFDGERAWQLPGGADHARLAIADATSALRHSAQLPTNILGLHEMAVHGHRVNFAGREDIGGVRYYVVVLTLDDGFETRYYLDPASFLITRARVRKALHPDLDPTPTTIEAVWSDFRKTAGVLYAFQSRDTDLATSKLLQTSTILDLRANPPVDETLFEMP